MKRFVEGVDRAQAVPFSERLDDCIDEDGPVHAIDDMERVTNIIGVRAWMQAIAA